MPDRIIGTNDILLDLMQAYVIAGSCCGSDRWHAEYNEKWAAVDRARHFYMGSSLESCD